MFLPLSRPCRSHCRHARSARPVHTRPRGRGRNRSHRHAQGHERHFRRHAGRGAGSGHCAWCRPGQSDPALRSWRARRRRDAHRLGVPRPREDYFTVVQWDQRGAGRSYPLNDPKELAPTTNLACYGDDAIELIGLLCKCCGKRKVFFIGRCWDSAVVPAVAPRPPSLRLHWRGPRNRFP